jgi:hypothetical protein
MFVPSHAKRTALSGVNQVVDGFVVDLDEGEEDAEPPFSLLFLINVFEGISDCPRNDALSGLIICPLYGKGLSGASLSVGEDGGVVPLDDPLH